MTFRLPVWFQTGVGHAVRCDLSEDDAGCYSLAGFALFYNFDEFSQNGLAFFKY